ncbi:MAG TPA: hypothetical protein PKD37_00835 [Oligoflexia bacterium]|nr:hypothetical protein [Oligoflexia bacterium]HMP26525.1 hypothetical protein [Oligoflexia bacterium]
MHSLVKDRILKDIFIQVYSIQTCKKRIVVKANNGFIMISVIMLSSLFLSLLAAYFVVTRLETASYGYSKGASNAFYAAEAGLNIRADIVKQIFVGFNRPSGMPPNISAMPCVDGNNGSGDFTCQTHIFNKRLVHSYLTENSDNPLIITIPPGERFQHLSAQEYRYVARALAKNIASGINEAKLELHFKTRLVPMFQFAAFYNKDLEILPGANMTLSGPIHTNGDLYLNTNSGRTLSIAGQITASRNIYRGRKDATSPNCSSATVQIKDPLIFRSLIPNCPSRIMVGAAEIAPFNGMIQYNSPVMTVPDEGIFEPTPGEVYWDKADLRLALKLNSDGTVAGIESRRAEGVIYSSQTDALNMCSGNIAGKAVGVSSIYNFREEKVISLLDVDLRGLLNCLYQTNWFGTSKQLSDSTEGGLVFFLTVDGPLSNHFANPYGVRISNAANIRSNISGSPSPVGLTIVSDQAVYLRGDFNSVNKIPASVLADSLNILSNSWNDANSAQALSQRIASNTTINAAFLSGTDHTGGVDGASGQGGAYNGGLENYLRLHENWSSKVLLYRGSFVSLWKARHVNGPWGKQSYSAPNRDWNYDLSFNNAANLPPLSPRFVFLKQELFVREFES